MKYVYKLPNYLFVVVLGFIAFNIYKYIRLANASNVFEIVEYSESATIGNPDAMILGVEAYTFLMMVGLLFAIILAVLRRDLLNFKAWAAIIIAVVFFLQAYLGAKMLFGIEQVINAKSFNAFSLSGQSLYGTIPMTLIFILVLALITKRRYGKLLDYIAPLWLTLLVFVRLGCFTIGCCGADSCTIAGIEMVLPVQLFEVALDLVLLQMIFNIEKKCECWGGGSSFFIMIGVYGIYRFMLEFIRNNSIVLLGFTYGQIYSIVCVIVAVFAISIIKKKCTEGKMRRNV